ncbi:MAG: hypothetical protein HS111_23300 [Kofleriaceae bacterium]|nr:hypothetical protein [Kofleriaceae bacterium]
MGHGVEEVLGALAAHDAVGDRVGRSSQGSPAWPTPRRRGRRPVAGRRAASSGGGVGSGALAKATSSPVRSAGADGAGGGRGGLTARVGADAGDVVMAEARLDGVEVRQGLSGSPDPLRRELVDGERVLDWPALGAELDRGGQRVRHRATRRGVRRAAQPLRQRGLARRDRREVAPGLVLDRIFPPLPTVTHGLDSTSGRPDPPPAVIRRGAKGSEAGGISPAPRESAGRRCRPG